MSTKAASGFLHKPYRQPGLVVPTGMTFGPDGFLYVSNFGAAPAGAGEILRISIP